MIPNVGDAFKVAQIAKPQLDKLNKATKQVEAIFLKDLLGQMRKNTFGKGLFGNTPGASMYEDMLNDAIAQSAAETGSFGVAKSLNQQFKRDVIRAAAGQIRLEAAARSKTLDQQH